MASVLAAAALTLMLDLVEAVIQSVTMTASSTPHYYIRLAHPLSADEWFRVVSRLKRHMHERGFEIDEFGDSHASDREAVRRAGQTAEFEGQVVYPSSATWSDGLLDFFSSERLEVSQSEFDGLDVERSARENNRTTS